MIKAFFPSLIITVLFCFTAPSMAPANIARAEMSLTTISIYSNPFRNRIRVEFAAALSDQARLELYHQNGRLIREIEPSSPHHFVIEKGQLAGGTYLFKVKMDAELLGDGTLFFLD